MVSVVGGADSDRDDHTRGSDRHRRHHHADRGAGRSRGHTYDRSLGHSENHTDRNTRHSGHTHQNFPSRKALNGRPEIKIMPQA